METKVAAVILIVDTKQRHDGGLSKLLVVSIFNLLLYRKNELFLNSTISQRKNQKYNLCVAHHPCLHVFN